MRQAAALPFVPLETGLQVLLTTSRKSGRWILPKGSVKRGEGLPEAATASDVAARTGAMLDQLIGLKAGDFPREQIIAIRPVARHVLSEARAVDAAERALLNGDLEAFGALLKTSHESLRSFGSSTEALDRLTHAMNEAGALGGRVTGAGFGGYAIAACRPESVDRVLAAARQATGGPAFCAIASKGLA